MAAIQSIVNGWVCTHPFCTCTDPKVQFYSGTPFLCQLRVSGPLIAAEKVETTPQLVARIKRSSKYYGQTAPNAWFDVRVVADTSYQLRGNGNNYRLSDVVLGMRLERDIVINLANGKTEKE